METYITLLLAPHNLTDDDIAIGTATRINETCAKLEHDTLSIHKVMEKLFTDKQIDIITMSAKSLPIKLLISDMDSTMISCECIDEIADFVGKKTEVSAITERAMNGELDFSEALSARVALLEGLDASVLEQVYSDRVRPMVGAKSLIEVARSNNCHTVLVSGGFTFFTGKVAAELGFLEHSGNTLEIVNGKLTGKVTPPILDKNSKVQALQTACEKLNISTASVMALGDGSNDIPMLQGAGLGIAFRAKPVVQNQVMNKLNHCNLDALSMIYGLHMNSR